MASGLSHFKHVCCAPSQVTGWGRFRVAGGGVARDPFDYMTARAAAEHCQVSEACIRQWVHRDLLRPAGRGPRGQLLFRAVDVARAEERTSRRAGRQAA